MTRYLPRPPDTVRTYYIFLSSGDDAIALRNRFKGLVDEVNNQFFDKVNVSIQVRRWEQVAPQRADGNLNDLFVGMAKKCHLTLVLLLGEIRPGTLEEVEGVLETPDAQLAVLWFQPGEGQEAGELRQFLERHQSRFLYNVVAGSPDSDEAWFHLVRVLTRVIVEALVPEPEESFREVR